MTVKTVNAAVLAVFAALAVLVLIIAALWVRNAAYRSAQRRRMYDRVLYSKLRPRLRTGDLVLFDSSAFNVVVKWASLAPYSHAGVVVVADGRPLIAEISRPGYFYARKVAVAMDAQKAAVAMDAQKAAVAGGAQKAAVAGGAQKAAVAMAPSGASLPPSAFVRMPRAASVLPLDARVRDYPGRVFVARLDRPLSAAQQARLVRAATSETRPFASVFDQLLGAGLGLWRPRSIHCCQHVCRLLNAAGARTERKALPESALLASLQTITRPEDIRFPGGARYTPPVEIMRA